MEQIAQKKGKGAAQGAPKESKVLRDEQTYTTKKKEWHILWKPSEFETVGSRTNVTKKGVMIEMFRGREFFPSKFLAGILKDPLYKGVTAKDLPLVELQAFLEEYAADPRTGIVRYEDRPRPQTQIELEEELKDVYAERRADKSIIEQQGEQIEEMRRKLQSFDKKA